MNEPKSLSRHAIARALDMGVAGDEIAEVIRCPEDTYRSTKYPDCVVYSGGNISLPVAPDGTVKTVLWRTNDLWRHAIESAPAVGRESFRHLPGLPD